MTTPQDRFELNIDDAVAKVFDDEAILMNITSAMYFSMDGAGTTIWQLLEAGHSVEQVTDAISSRYEVDHERASADVLRLAGELADARLLQPTDEPAPPLDEPDSGDLPYAEPQLNEYGDMSDLLALDPPMPGIVDTPWTDPKPPAGPDAGE